MDLATARAAARQASDDYENATSLSEEADAAERLVRAFRAVDAALPPETLPTQPTAEMPEPRFEVCATTTPGCHAIWDTAFGVHVSDSIGDAVIAGITVFRSEEHAQRVADRLNAAAAPTEENQ